MRKGFFAHPFFGWVAVILISSVGLLGLAHLRDPDKLAILGVSGLVSMGIIGTWRWSWFACHVLRSRLFLHWVFPRWRRKANAVPVEDIPPICFIVPTYKEQPWITERVFRAIAREVKTLVHPTTIVVNSSSDAENEAIREILESEIPGLESVRLILMLQKDGKRKAMADALRDVAQLDLPSETIVALMDGDSELSPGTLRKCLPFFRLFPKLGALTTDELPIVGGSYLFSEWFHLRFAQRHYQMCSLSLSEKVLCLTGRFSLFRGEAALHPTFADRLETDTLDDWLWGRFKFLSGDDKSTWYWLLSRGYDMIYVPDTIVYSIETISGSLTKRAYNNMRRWYGNMLRNSDRALALGPGKMGWFIWYCLLDQRISIWTALITPSLLLLAIVRGQWLVFGILCCWILFSRPLMLSIIFIGRQSHLKPLHLPMLLLSQWSSAGIKVWTQMNLAQQKWANRGNQSISAAGTGVERFLKVNTSKFLMWSQVFAFAIALLGISGIVNPTGDLTGLWWRYRNSTPPASVRIVDAANYGIVPNDRLDDGEALQALIDDLDGGLERELDSGLLENVPENGDLVQINLPLGELDLDTPLYLHRSNLILQGIGAGRTIFQAHFDLQAGNAIVSVRPQDEVRSNPQPWLENLQLNGFTLRYLPGNAEDAGKLANSIELQRVRQASLKYLQLDSGTDRALRLQDTENVSIEYVAMDEFSQEAKIVMENAVNTQIADLLKSDPAS